VKEPLRTLSKSPMIVDFAACPDVRDEGVAGSNPATPTNKSPDRSMSFRTIARTAKGALGQLLGQKRRSRLPPPSPDPENGIPGAVGTATGAEVQSVLSPAPLRIVVEATASHRKWTARLRDRVLCTSVWPFVKSARLLLAEGHPADTVIEIWRPNTDEWAMRGRLGTVAATVIDGEAGSRGAKNWPPARDLEQGGREGGCWSAVVVGPFLARAACKRRERRLRGRR
jgi:hypothetical protein